MTQTYRTDDFARWGAGQGFNLSPAQVDNNFWDLIQRMIAQEARPDPSAGIAYFEIVGVMMYVHMTDGEVLGPYELPVAIFRDRGEWAPSVPYSKMDTFSINGGLWVVIFDHTSGATFDPGANDGAGHDYYQLMIQTPGSALPANGLVGQILEKATTTDYAMMWGYKTPSGGTARDVIVKKSSTQDDAEWDTLDASEIEFTPATGSTLTSDNVSSALEELAADNTGLASDITYTPVTGSLITSDNVQEAIDQLAEAVPASTLGRQTIWVPALSMFPRTTNGPASGSFQTTGNLYMVKTLDFDATVAEYAQFDIVFPKSADLGAGLRFQPFWSHATATGSYDVLWVMNSSALRSGNQLNEGPGSSGSSFISTGGVADRLYYGPESGMFYPTNGADRRYCQMQIYRLATNGSDTLAVDARLHGVLLFYTTTAATDD